jgi:hypothetical protein
VKFLHIPTFPAEKKKPPAEGDKLTRAAFNWR